MKTLTRKVSNRFLTLFPGWFGCFFVLCLAHRVFAVFNFYYVSFLPTYNPKDKMDGIRLWIQILGESTVLGVSYDALLAALLGGIAVFLARPLRFALFFAFAVFLAANIDHIVYNHSNISFSTAHLGANITFLKGMVTQNWIVHVLLLLLAGGATLALLRAKPLRRAWGVMGIVILALAASFPARGNFAHPTWLQSNPLLGSPLSATDGIDDRQFSEAVLDRREPDGSIPQTFNILIVYMEGLSKLSMEIGDMEALSGLAERNIEFSRYVGPQLITANGLFSSLTGHLPNFARSGLKWASGEADMLAGALPDLMRAQGYHTAFLQSADLGFMSKGEMMPRFGFETVRGMESWGTAYSANGWGIDDRALFEETLGYIDTLDQQQRWLVSVLTTGTHAPYNVPSDFLPDAELDRYRALRYLDDAVRELVDGLDARGLLDNTIVVLTSDESRERSSAGDMQSQLALNWLPLVILHPSRRAMQIDDYISAVELPNLILALGPGTPADHLTAFDPVRRPLVFGNVYSKRLYWFDPQNRVLLACDTIAFVCAQFDDVADPFVSIGTQPAKVASYPFLRQLIVNSEAPE